MHQKIKLNKESLQLLIIDVGPGLHLYIKI